MKLSRTKAFNEAFEHLQKGGPFTFVTGRAGTGKSTLLKHFRTNTNLIAPVLAPTGVAALNVDGETIHRFFRFSPGITVQEARKKATSSSEGKMYRKADLLIIDEISMVRADLLDCIDQFLRVIRRNSLPFGGLRVVVIGDLYQLPPVITSGEREAFSQLYESAYFFASHVVKELLEANYITFIELEKVYRQSDPTFISLLNSVRNRSISEDDLRTLNLRVQANPAKEAIVLTSVNASADERNETRLKQLPKDITCFEGVLEAGFPEREVPTDIKLRLKKGARVMCLANDKNGRFVNGSLGYVIGFTTVEKKEEEQKEPKEPVKPSVIVELDSGETVSITPHTWSMYRSTFNQTTKTLDQEKLGSFTQIPLKLAWAVTIHKSQGKTFDEVTVDLGNGAFAAGQTYVALSRCRSFEGLSLVKPVRLQDIQIDRSIATFIAALQSQPAKPSFSLKQTVRRLRQTL